MLALVVFLMGIDANNKYNSAQKSMSLFKKEYELKCRVTAGPHSSPSIYKVSINNGWEIDNKYFLKDSMAIRVEECEKW